MIIQVVLLTALGAMLLYALSQHKRAFAPAMVMVSVSVVGGVFVLMPDLTSAIAHWVGVGRGADLILYCFVVLMLAAVMNIHLRLRAEREIITELTRSIAILSASKPERKSDAR